MTRITLITALLCLSMSLVLVVMSWRRLGAARLVLRTLPSDLDGLAPGLCKVSGVLEPSAALVLGPFTERPAVYVHARMMGVGPEGGPPRVLWDKLLTTASQVSGDGRSIALEMAGALVLVPRQYRQGALRALVPEVKIVPRVLARSGYKSPPPSTQWFYLEEELLAAGEEITVVGLYDGKGTIKGGPATPLIVSNLNPWRIVLRVAWGPAFAMLLATIVMLTGVTVVATSLWLR